jgi:hypothetical protein
MAPAHIQRGNHIERKSMATIPKKMHLSRTLASTLTEKQAKTRLSKAQKANLAMRKLLWPTISESQLWLRKERDGFTTIPRTMPLFMEIINDASKQVTNGKSIPAGRSYLVLWCRVFDEGLVKIESESTAAMEAGYIGERNVSTWREHLRVLKELGFIDFAEGPAGPCQYVLLLNPYHAVRTLKTKGWVQNLAFTALVQRAMEIGADDLNDESKAF